MTTFIFLIGNPASGKTSLYYHIEQKLARAGLTAWRVNDSEFFFQAIALDASQEFHTASPDGTHSITDPRFFDLQLRLLRERLLESEWIEDWVFVELTSSDYTSTMDRIGIDLLSTSALILVKASLDTCLRRNSTRPDLFKPVDDNRVPDEYIIRCANQPIEPESLAVYFDRSLIVENDSDDPGQLKLLADEAFSFILEKS